MAYNKKNYYKRIVEIQDITQVQKHQFGLTYKEIFHKFIEKQYHICKRTYDEYLGIPAARELKKIEAKEIEKVGQQLKINFND